MKQILLILVCLLLFVTPLFACLHEAFGEGMATQVTDRFGTPISGQAVTYTVTQGSGQFIIDPPPPLPIITVWTDSDGIAAASPFILGPIGEINYITADFPPPFFPPVPSPLFFRATATNQIIPPPTVDPNCQLTTYDNTPLLWGTTVPNNLIKIYTTDGVLFITTPPADYLGNWSIEFSYLAEGSYNFLLQSSDPANGIYSDYTPITITIIVDRTKPAPFELISPTNGSRVFTNRPSFVWTAATDETTVKYTLYIGTITEPWTAPIVLVPNIQNTYWTLNKLQALPSLNAYYWTVKAEDSNGNIRWASGSMEQEAHCIYVVGSDHTGGPAVDPCNEAKDPAGSTVDYASGNLNLDIDITHIVPNTSLPTNLTLYYNSLDTINGVLGPNWTHTFNQRITPTADYSYLTYLTATGRRLVYSYDSYDPVAGTYNYIPFSEYGDYSQIAFQLSDWTYRLTKKDRTIYYFDNQGRLTQIEDRNGNLVICNYFNGNLTTVTLPNNQQITINYLPNNLINSIIDPAGNETVITYNAEWQLFNITKNGVIWRWQFTYQPDPNLITSVLNPNNIITIYEYNSVGRIYRVVDGNGQAKTFVYDEVNSIATITDRAGKTTVAKYNLALDNWLDRTDPLGNITLNVFDNNRNLLSRTNSKGNTTTYTYDNRGNVLTVTNALSYTTTYAYGDISNPDLPTTITDAANVVTSLTYDSAGNLLTSIQALGTAVEQTTIWEYYTITDGNPSAVGKVKKETRDPSTLSLISTYSYINGYLWRKTVDPDGLNIFYQTDYDVLGQVTTSYCPRSLQPSFIYTYDYRGNRTTIQTFINPTTSYFTNLEYDLMDHLTWRIEDVGGLNIATQYQYDNVGRLIRTTIDPLPGLNIQTQNFYDAVGRIVQTIDPEGATTNYEYYDNGWLKSTSRQLTPLLYAVTQYEYDANGNRTKVTDPESHITQYTYTILNQLATTTDPENNVTTYSYNNIGLTEWVQDARGNKTYSYYDELRRIKYVRTPESNITTAYVYDKVGRTTQAIGPWYDSNQNGIVDAGESCHPTNNQQPTTNYSNYDKADRVIETWTNSHPKTLYGYDKASNVIQVTDPTGAVTTSLYDRCSELILTTVDPTGLNEQTKYIYDKIGRQTEVHTAFGTALETTTYSVYDNANRLIRQYTAVPVYATNYALNKRGQQILVTDAEGRFTLYAYDLSGRLIQTRNARLNNVDYAYDKDGLRTQVTYYKNALPVPTFYTYYNNHLLKTTDYPGFSGRNLTTNNYDANGNLTSKTDAKSQTINYQYDNNNRLTLKQYNTETVAYTYDASSNLLTTVDNNTDTENAYDDLSRLTTVTNRKYSPSKILTYSYYEDGLRKTMTEPEGGLVEYAYDNAKRLTSVKRNSIVEGSYEYNTLGLRTKITLGNGSYTEYFYDPITRWLRDMFNRKSDGSIISSFTYTCNLVGNRTSMALANGDLVVYAYDPTYQLINELRTGSSPYSISWTYDEVGNRLTQTKNQQPTTYNYNDANQLISEISGLTTTSYTYDNNGNQTSKIIGADTWQWGYDYENKQISYTDPITSTNNATYVYDAGGARIEKNVNGVAEKYIYDGANIIVDYDGSNNVKAQYVTPFLDQNLIMIRGGNTYYYMQDGLGSVRNLLDSNQEVKNSYDYYAFGEALNWVETVENRYTYTAREWDTESQTNYFRARNQDPRIGRFLSADPIEYGGGINLYSYVGNNPANSIDPEGTRIVLNEEERAARITVNAELIGTVDGDCGKLRRDWNFRLSAPAPCDGHVIQKVDYKRVVFTCVPFIKYIWEYTIWEEFPVKMDSIEAGQDNWESFGENNTIGEVKITGELRFFCRSTTHLSKGDTHLNKPQPSGWGPVSREVPGGAGATLKLHMATFNRPSWWNPIIGKTRSITKPWICCGEEKSLNASFPYYLPAPTAEELQGIEYSSMPNPCRCKKHMLQK